MLEFPELDRIAEEGGGGGGGWDACRVCRAGFRSRDLADVHTHVSASHGINVIQYLQVRFLPTIFCPKRKAGEKRRRYFCAGFAALFTV